MDLSDFQKLFSKLTNFRENPYHPLVWINGEPEIGEAVYIGGFSEINAMGARVVLGDNCDIASFVSINCADSHKICIEISDEIERGDIILEIMYLLVLIVSLREIHTLVIILLSLQEQLWMELRYLHIHLLLVILCRSNRDII